jgi:mannose-6-phosphate isomerase-like protein (cupin superfamily)
MQLVHEDDRRKLFSFPEAKLIIAKADAVIGNHYHKIKEESFILSEGTCFLYQKNESGKDIEVEMQIGKIYTISPGTQHTFHLVKDSILIGLNSRPYDAADDYRF